ncbi:MAG TPA: hypothetical protein VLL52_04025 [Anaerolineae bacterium]|nr:hypothetical protein [Anaerolineae bacterium]
MMDDLIATGTLNVAYAGMLMLSIVFTLISLLGVGAGEALDFDMEIDTDGSFDFISVSPFALALFFATFGAMGLVTRLGLGMEAVQSLVVATVAALAVGIMGQAFFVYILSPTVSSNFTLEDLVGREAEVVTTIPADGRGEIGINNASGRLKLAARSTDHESIAVSSIVVIERLSGRLAIVSPVEDKLSGVVADVN